VKCPHCLVNFHDSWQAESLGEDSDGAWGIRVSKCPACNRLIVYFGRCHGVGAFGAGVEAARVEMGNLVRPKGTARAPLPAEVPGKFADDYREACLVFADSAKASAALSRRCLQNLIREHAGVKPGNLFDEIQEVLDSGKLPADLADALHAVREVGNFAAHPIKSRNTGEVIDVEPGEAEWQLDTLESLFDFYFVRPAALKAKRDTLNAKLKDAGKKPLK